MFKSSARQLFFGFLMISASACAFWRPAETTVTSIPASSSEQEIKGEIPFATREPEIYQTEIIIKTYAAGIEKSERKIFTARSAERRLTIYNGGEKTEIERLDFAAEGKTVSILHGKKIYMESVPDSKVSNGSAPEDDFLTVELLNRKTGATFENLGTENNITAFRVRLGDVENANFEILIYVDETLKIPVKQEFYTVGGEQRTLTVSIELRNFQPQPDGKIFELPKDFRKVSPKEFREAIWGSGGKE